MKQSALKQDAEVIQPTDQMQKIHGPLDSKLPGGLQAAQAVLDQHQQADGIEEEETIHVAPGKVYMGQPIPLLV